MEIFHQTVFENLSKSYLLKYILIAIIYYYENKLLFIFINKITLLFVVKFL